MGSFTLDQLIHEYARSHRNLVNEVIHCICVPAIVFAVLGALLSAGIFVVIAALVVAILYYASWSLRAGLEMAVMLAAMLTLWLVAMPTHHIRLYAIGIFIVAWVGQFVGHAIEGAKPSFLADLKFLMIGPLYVIAILKRKPLGIDDTATP